MNLAHRFVFVPDDTVELPAFVLEARHAERRLRARLRRSDFDRSRVSEILRKLRWHRRRDEQAIIYGPSAHCASLRHFLTEYRACIDHLCKPVARRIPR